MGLSCQVERFQTPKGYFLNGLSFGEFPARTGFIFIHGLAGSLFNHHEILVPLLDGTSAALYFNNRGHDKAAYIKRQAAINKQNYVVELAGEAFEVFEHCVDDIQGAVNLLGDKGVENIYLVGHSTGCQKSIYYLSKNLGTNIIQGVILLCPMSDYAFSLTQNQQQSLGVAVNYARKMIAQDQAHDLMPSQFTTDLIDAQRYLSLNTPDSEEEIFSYANQGKPTILSKINTPMLVVLAAMDEYGDRPVEDIATWFKQASPLSSGKIEILSGLTHNLSEDYGLVRECIKKWLVNSGKL